MRSKEFHEVFLCSYLNKKPIQDSMAVESSQDGRLRFSQIVQGKPVVVLSANDVRRLRDKLNEFLGDEGTTPDEPKPHHFWLGADV